ncbi:hypothetical protein JGS22_023215 [Streptomyces sp. P38-E01]|uniref:Uncharacterized protein n=1 Tax=Streptomyces tardus TaxID=2780544 RepID=A0A949NAA7_9ACTN|nr:hypothetical protein [Streptomyces tardus]
MIEELRVSYFAHALPTPPTRSARRIRCPTSGS